MNRIKSIDTFRLLAIISVISIHTTPFSSEERNGLYKYLSTAINQGARWAVPFFFVISGYFFAKKIKTDESVVLITINTLKKLFFIWLFFSIIYIFPYELFSSLEYGFVNLVKISYYKLLNIVDDPIEFVFQGSKFHLWFLVSLACSVIITALFLHYWPLGFLTPLIIFSFGLYVFGLLGQSYSETPFGISIDFNTRNGPFFSTIFFVMGYLLSFLEFHSKYIIYGLLLMIFGYAIHFAEVFYLYSTYDIVTTRHDFLFGTLFLGLGASLMALSNHQLLNINSLSKIGGNTLGIYGIHLVFVDILQKVDSQISHPIWEIGYVLIVFVLSFLVTLIFSKSKRLKKLFI